ncbi:hypothetical protein QWZ06_07635 [Chryseobacterium tructae]|uniref:Bacteriocin n=1 Tax=Chryseobacterium tructae TaxID=1037380 RepID=A0ABV7XW57_9FLAO|nr:hypothetical protein [Chryseobacterium tructae]MDN3692140.1 hypothetical protein [Chryseobacterium tructae]
MKKNVNKTMNLSTLKVIDQKKLATLHGGLQQMEDSLAPAAFTSLFDDTDKGSFSSLFSDIDK